MEVRDMCVYAGQGCPGVFDESIAAAVCAGNYSDCYLRRSLFAENIGVKGYSQVFKTYVALVGALREKGEDVHSLMSLSFEDLFKKADAFCAS